MCMGGGAMMRVGSSSAHYPQETLYIFTNSYIYLSQDGNLNVRMFAMMLAADISGCYMVMTFATCPVIAISHFHNHAQ